MPGQSQTRTLRPTEAIRDHSGPTSLKVIGYRVKHAETGELLHKACFSRKLAEERAEKQVSKGVPAFVERTDGKAV